MSWDPEDGPLPSQPSQKPFDNGDTDMVDVLVDLACIQCTPHAGARFTAMQAWEHAVELQPELDMMAFFLRLTRRIGLRDGLVLHGDLTMEMA